MNRYSATRGLECARAIPWIRISEQLKKRSSQDQDIFICWRSSYQSVLRFEWGWKNFENSNSLQKISGLSLDASLRTTLGLMWPMETYGNSFVWTVKRFPSMHEIPKQWWGHSWCAKLGQEFTEPLYWHKCVEKAVNAWKNDVILRSSIDFIKKKRSKMLLVNFIKIQRRNIGF